MHFKLVQPWNTVFPSLSPTIEYGMLTVLSFLQPEKALSSIILTDSGILTFSKNTKFLKAFLPIFVTDGGIFAVFIVLSSIVFWRISVLPFSTT